MSWRWLAFKFRVRNRYQDWLDSQVPMAELDLNNESKLRYAYLRGIRINVPRGNIASGDVISNSYIVGRWDKSLPPGPLFKRSR